MLSCSTGFSGSANKALEITVRASETLAKALSCTN
jgi:hypothetical protein